jgi:hypothetical protein
MNAIEAKKSVIMSKNSHYFRGAIQHIYGLIEDAAKNGEPTLIYKWVHDNKLSDDKNAEQLSNAIKILALDGFIINANNDYERLYISWR